MTFRSEVDALRARVEGLSGENESLVAQIERLEATLAAHEERRARAEEAGTAEDAEALRRANAELEGRVRALGFENAGLRTLCAELRRESKLLLPRGNASKPRGRACPACGEPLVPGAVHSPGHHAEWLPAGESPGWILPNPKALRFAKRGMLSGLRFEADLCRSCHHLLVPISDGDR